ncbi:MAG: ChaN family lipoprotein [Bacteroidales bacterium]|nr:ChaN family lipoprotein [Bacteroidales bacterium]MCF8405301.1 ChaN family lipoprotein [Bacteroidales bacterium]
MNKTNLVGIFLAVILLTAMKGDKSPYKFFNANGKKANYTTLFKDAVNADIVFFGELHNNPIGHWIQLELTEDLFAEKGNKLVLGAEMFESDNQLIIDEYFSGKVKTKTFEKEARLWPNYSTDYKPLLEFAKENKLDFIATNIPRRYASLVNDGGFEELDSLTDEAKSYFAPLPVDYDPEVNCYKSMIEMMGGMGGHVTPNIPKAQAIKDATMAHFILENWEPGKTFLHYNGSYHSDDYEGIVWWIKQAKPDLNILTVSTVEQDTIAKLTEENTGIADYIICVPTNMTKTY